MKVFKALGSIFKAYDYRDKLLSVAAVAIFLLMVVKMMVFPYGFFDFGSSDLYTEGLVSKNGIQNLNPLFVDYNEADREVSRLLFSGLMKYNPEMRAVVDDMGQLSINEEKTEYTFKIREGLQWSDGKAVTAADVYFTYSDIILSDTFPNQILTTNFAGVEFEQIDDMTVKFTLEKPNIFFVTNFTTGILPAHILSGVGAHDLLQHDFNKMPVGSGPYMATAPVEKFADGRMQVTLERSPYYSGEHSNIEQMRIITYPTMEELITEISSVNGVVKITGEDKAYFEESERFQLVPYELPQYTAVFLNMESKLLKDNENVRLALQKAVDKEVLIDILGSKKAVDTPLMELNQEDWLYQASEEQAQGALKEAGFEYADSDTEKLGIRYNNDEEALELNFVARLYDEGTPQFEEVKETVTYLQDVWEGIGFSIQVELLPQDMFNERIMSRTYDLLLVGQSLGYNLDTYSYWHSTQADPMGQNLSNYKSFNVDSMIENVRSEFDPEIRTEQLNTLAEQIKDDTPAVFLYRPVYYYALDGKISGLSMEGVVFPGDRFAGISLWKFER